MARTSKNATRDLTSDEPSTARFEQALGGLEQAVLHLESGELSLDQALARYEQGLAFLLQCRKLLTDAEQRVALLTAVDESGLPKTATFDTRATFDPDAASPRPAPHHSSVPFQNESDPSEPPF